MVSEPSPASPSTSNQLHGAPPASPPVASSSHSIDPPDGPSLPPPLPVTPFAERIRRARLIDLAMMALVFVLTFAFYLSGIGLQRTPFHQDESRWINRAHYLTDAFDPFGPTWNDQYLARGQPPVGSYAMGLGLLLQGRDLDTNGAWDFRRDTEWNIAHGNMPDEADLAAGRRWSAFLGAASAALVYLTVRQLTNPLGGLVAVLFLVANPLQVWHMRLALADPTLTFTLALLFLVTIRLMRHPSWVWAILAGVLIGLGGANKFTPIALAAPLAAIGVAMLLWGWWDRRHLRGQMKRGLFGLPAFSDHGWKLVSIPFTALATFVAVYPYLWPNPLTRTLKLIDFRRAEGESQVRHRPEWAVDGPIDGLRTTIDALGNRWSAIQEPFGTGHVSGLSDALSMGDVLFAVVGLALLVWIGARKGIRSAELAIAALIIFQTLTIAASMRIAFERYYLPIVLGEVIAIGCAFGYIATIVARRWRDRSPEAAA